MPESSAAKTSRMKWGAAATPTQHANRRTGQSLAWGGGRGRGVNPQVVTGRKTAM